MFLILLRHSQEEERNISEVLVKAVTCLTASSFCWQKKKVESLRYWDSEGYDVKDLVG